MKIVITGAGGFVGRALTQRLLADDNVSLTLVDNQFPPDTALNNSAVRCVQGQLQDNSVRRQAFEDGVDVLFHLAALPGGAAEANPALSKQVNLDATLALFEEAAAVGNCPRVVFTSTIAVLGATLPEVVNDDCPIQPAMIYGTHKAMAELALADMTRRGLVDSVAVRLPGIVARPAATNGMKSAFISNIFHALKAGESFVCPTSHAATSWIMSVSRCAANLVHAAKLNSQSMPASRVVTLPAWHCTMGELAASIAAATDVPDALVSYQPDLELEAHFGSYPPLHTPAAERAGFVHDGSLQQLVQAALAVL